MFEPNNIETGMVEALWITLIRAGVITEEDLSRTADEVEAAADRPGGQEDEMEMQRAVAHALRCVLLHVEGAGETTGQYEERTARERIRKRLSAKFNLSAPDGGNR